MEVKSKKGSEPPNLLLNFHRIAIEPQIYDYD